MSWRKFRAFYSKKKDKLLYLCQKWSMPSVISLKLLQGEDFLTWIQAIILHWMRSRNISVSVAEPPWGSSAANNQDVQLLGDGSWGLKWFWQTVSHWGAASPSFTPGTSLRGWKGGKPPFIHIPTAGQQKMVALVQTLSPACFLHPMGFSDCAPGHPWAENAITFHRAPDCGLQCYWAFLFS